MMRVGLVMLIIIAIGKKSLLFVDYLLLILRSANNSSHIYQRMHHQEPANH
jgi:hypothetical protein